MSIINLTPHMISVTNGTEKWDILPSGNIARATEHPVPTDPIDGIPTTRVSFGTVEDLPTPSPAHIDLATGDFVVVDTYYVVSALAAASAHRSGRTYVDLLVPGQQIRDSNGRIIGCASLCRWRP